MASITSDRVQRTHWFSIDQSITHKLYLSPAPVPATAPVQENPILFLAFVEYPLDGTSEVKNPGASFLRDEKEQETPRVFLGMKLKIETADFEINKGWKGNGAS